MLGEQRMGDGSDVFDCAIRMGDTELDRILSLLLQCLPHLFAHPVAIVWMDTLEDSFGIRKTLRWLKVPDSVAFLRPVEIPARVKDRGAGMAQPLCFGQISFAASE